MQRRRVKWVDDLEPSSYLVIKQVGDGNCLFRALAWCVDNTAQRHARVRREVCGYISSRAARDALFAAYIMARAAPSDIGAYVNSMSQDKAHGGAIEIAAWALTHKACVRSYSPVHVGNRRVYQLVTSIDHREVEYEIQRVRLPNGKRSRREHAIKPDCSSPPAGGIVLLLWSWFGSLGVGHYDLLQRCALA